MLGVMIHPFHDANGRTALGASKLTLVQTIPPEIALVPLIEVPNDRVVLEQDLIKLGLPPLNSIRFSKKLMILLSELPKDLNTSHPFLEVVQRRVPSLIQRK